MGNMESVVAVIGKNQVATVYGNYSAYVTLRNVCEKRGLKLPCGYSIRGDERAINRLAVHADTFAPVVAQMRPATAWNKLCELAGCELTRATTL